MGASGYAIGVMVSALLDLPTGAVTVWALALAAIVMALLTPHLTRRREITGM